MNKYFSKSFCTNTTIIQNSIEVIIESKYLRSKYVYFKIIYLYM
jgi:hypothetical protein